MSIGVAVCTGHAFWIAGAEAAPFVNWETPHVHPLDMTPDGTRLLAVNTADARLEVFDVTSATPVHIGSIPVGVDPVSVRARTDAEAWVVNHISDSVSVVDLTTMNVRRTLRTLDEPADVVFAGSPQRAFVSCSQANTVQVFDPMNLAAPPVDIPIVAEDPRAMAVSPDGATVFVAIFESGNGSTILGGGAAGGGTIAFPPNVVSDPLGPYGGQNPPPNDGNQFNPPMNPSNPPPPPVGLIVKKDDQGRWMDDNNGDWTSLVSGPQAFRSGRPVGWDLPDRDVAIIDADSLTVTYAHRMMNICMAIAVNPTAGQVTVVGTDGTNEIRFEPVLQGRFLRVESATFDPSAPDPATVTDLNPHLTYTSGTIPQAQRDASLGDPRGIAFNAAGTRGYVSGMGSNNVVAVDGDGLRVPGAPTIEVGEGPTGLALDEQRDRLYVLNKFAATVSVVDTDTETELTQVPLFDPTPPAIKVGRKHLYDTHKNSGLGHIACASCHVDGRMDRLAWDLGAPDGNMKPFNQNCNFNLGPIFGQTCQDYHPMKGPMNTQTLQDIIGKEPFHWRGDRDGLEEFNGAFVGLQGDDAILTPVEMQQYEDFLATITFPPNPFRNFDNTLPANLPLPGHFTSGRFAPAGLPLPNGNAVAGLNSYRTGLLDGGGAVGVINCVTCHTLPTGAGTNLRLVGGNFLPFPTGPNGENHLTIVSVDGSTNVSIKVPHLRNLHEKVGFDATQTSNRAGFGFIHDGSVDSISRFVSEPVFSVTSDQQVANLVAFMLAFSGSDLPIGTTGNFFELLGPSSKDTHAAVGRQVTVDGNNNDDPAVISLIADMMTLADAGRIGLIAKGRRDGIPRGYAYVSPNMLQTDRTGEVISVSALRMAAGMGEEVTFTVVPFGAQTRMGIDRDQDGHFDRDEIDACADHADAASTPDNVIITGDSDGDADVDLVDFGQFDACVSGPDIAADPACRCTFDFDLDGDVDGADFQAFQIEFTGP